MITADYGSRSGVHYISDSLYSMGSLCCAVCGHQFPLSTSPHGSAMCGNCGTAHSPGTLLTAAFQEHHHQTKYGGGGGSSGDAVSAEQWASMAAARFFTSDEIAAAVARVARACGDLAYQGCKEASEDGGLTGGGGDGGMVRVGQTAVDNRVLEEAFCDNCGTHRMCKSFARQTRSADEGQTIFYQCTICSTEWQQNS